MNVSLARRLVGEARDLCRGGDWAIAELLVTALVALEDDPEPEPEVVESEAAKPRSRKKAS